MKKFINDPEYLVDELLEGFAIANSDRVALAGTNLVVRAQPKPEDKVALVTLGGSGHEPALSGFVGKVLILSSALEVPSARWVFAVVLVAGLLSIVAVGRAGSTLFWSTSESESTAGAVPRSAFEPPVILLLVAIAMAMFAGRVVDYATATAAQLVDPHGYIEAVFEAGADLPESEAHGPEHGPEATP